jgi:hypothetical protein
MVYKFNVNTREGCSNNVIKPEYLRAWFSDILRTLYIKSDIIYRHSIQQKYFEINGDCKLHLLCVQLLACNRSPDNSLMPSDVNPVTPPNPIPASNLVTPFIAQLNHSSLCPTVKFLLSRKLVFSVL